MNLAAAFHAVPRGIPLPAFLPFPPPGGYPPEGIVAADWIIRRATELGLTVKKTGRQRLRITGRALWRDPGVAQLAAEIRRMNFAWIVHAPGNMHWEGMQGLDFRDAGTFWPEPPAAHRAAKEAADAAYRTRESAMLRALAEDEERTLAVQLERNRKAAGLSEIPTDGLQILWTPTPAEWARLRGGVAFRDNLMIDPAGWGRYRLILWGTGPIAESTDERRLRAWAISIKAAANTGAAFPPPPPASVGVARARIIPSRRVDIRGSL